MYYIVYETTNNINNKKYIGMHSTYDLEDSYIGSGKLIKKALKKYGRSSFTREILFICDSYEEMAIKEKELITQTIIEDSNYYNLKTGGEGGRLTDEIINKIRIANIGRVVSIESIEQALETRRINGTWYKSGEEHVMYGKEHSIESRNKVSSSLVNYYADGNIPWNKGLTNHESIEERKKYGRNTAGDLNPAMGSKWLGNLTLGVKCYIKKQDTNLENTLKSLGWVEKPSNFNSLKSVTKNIQEYLNDR